MYDVNNFREHTKCCICLSDFDENEEIGITDCFHVFHYCCLIDWGKYKTSCPLCLEKIAFNDDNSIINGDNKEDNIINGDNKEDNIINEDNKEDNSMDEEDENISIIMSITNCSREDALYSFYFNSNLQNAILYLFENNDFFN